MLIKCPECGNKRSSEADACPHCGCKRKGNDIGCFGLLSAIAIGVIMFTYSENTSSKNVYITKNNVNYRSAPNGKVLGKLPKGTQVSCVVADGWCKTEKDNRSVYISLNVLDKNDQGKKVTPEREYVEEDVSVRQKKGLIAVIGE